MNKKIVVKIALIICVTFLFSGCSLIDKFFVSTSVKVDKVLTPEEMAVNGSIHGLILGYFKSIYAEPIEVSYKNSVFGIVPDSLMDKISADTKKEKTNTMELPLHYPRFIEINGLTCVGYQILKDEDINARFYELSSDNLNFSYLVDINLRAKVLNNADFATYFKYNGEKRVIEKIGEVPENVGDYIRINAKYDVLVNNTEEVYTIKRAVESTLKDNAMRLNKINNDFIKRISYFNVNEPTDKTTYENESQFVMNYIQKFMLAFDKDKFSIFRSKWKKDAKEVSDYLNILGLLNNEQGQPYLFNINDPLTYKKRFDIDILPIKSGIERVVSCEVSANEDPSFMEKQRNYRIIVNANVAKTEGMVGSSAPYTFEYLVNVTKNGDILLINSIELNQFVMLRS